MRLRNNGIRHLAKNDNGAKANRKGSCYWKKKGHLGKRQNKTQNSR